ncbi:hypothetical protein [Aristophania vespae]|uniref:hypothetical protein n=1 Tax=Aristophania vespae TaxID=2697033 RepID=UPI00350E4F95
MGYTWPTHLARVVATRVGPLSIIQKHASLLLISMESFPVSSKDTNFHLIAEAKPGRFEIS